MILRARITVLTGIVTTILSCYFGISIIDGSPEQRISILSTVVQVSVSMMGFMLAALAILASITDKPLIKSMAQQGLYRDLLLSLFVACTVYMLSFLVSGSVLLIGDYGFHWKQLLIGALSASIASTLQIGWKFWKVLSNLNIAD